MIDAITYQATASTNLGLRRSRFWPYVFAVLIIAQIALLVHQFEHRTHFDAENFAEDCALCSFASAMAAAPPSAAIAAPLYTKVEHIVATATEAVAELAAPSGFLARAPPSLLSV